MYHLRKLKSLLLLLCVAVTAKAQLSDGKVYNFVNVEYSKSLAITSGEYITIVPTNVSGSEQLWYAQGDDTNGYTLRSLCSGYYLRSSNGQSSKWTMVSTPDANCKLKSHSVGGNYTFRATNTANDNHSMHLATSQGSHIVGWASSAPATQWRVNEVSLTAEKLNELLTKVNEVTGTLNNVATYQDALNTLFSDKACTTLNSTYASMNETDLKNQTAFTNLPTTLQNMVLKVHNNSWAEENYDDSKGDWDADYAKKYRVQFYEPYNEPEAAAKALGLNAHTNLNNPTGIFANVQDILYVMVDGEIKEGSSLYLASYTGHGKLGGYEEGIQLHQGLNIIPSFEAGTNYCINYVVHTFDTSDGKKGNKAKVEEHRLSNYSDLKIHIEGGYINGYWNKMGDYNQADGNMLYTPDNHTNWDYIAERATQTDVTILGEYITLQFPLHSAIDNEGNSNNGMSHYLSLPGININDVINEWDKVMMWERFLLGVASEEATMNRNVKSPYSEREYVVEYTGHETDGFESGYDDYYNVHGLSFGTPHGYMYGSWDHCGYHFNTMGAIMTTMITDAGSHWGPAHEIGHQHQGLLTFNGLTEVTNNLFSNVVLWYYGKTTSRVNGSALEPVLDVFSTEGADFFNINDNVFITTQMYYKLFLYYHVLGHNPKFYPRLFEMLRQDPMSTGYNQQGSTTLLHFYKKCCEAAGEDLTEFFRAYSFFNVMSERLVGDYANSVYTQTQDDIDAAIAEVKAMAEEKGWKENIAVLFINDDTGENIKSHRDDQEYLTPFESADSELGSYASYVNTTEPNYTYTIAGNTVTMTGEGGTGIAIFNKNGELIGFSDNKTFEVSDECAIAIASGQAEVVAMKADNTTVEAVDIMDTDNTEAKHVLLGELLDDAEAIVGLTDETNKKLGFYKKEVVTDLQTAYTNAKTVYDDKTVASYDAVYDALNEAYSEVLHNDYARIGLVVGNAYRLENKNYAGRLMTVNSGTNVMSGLEEYKDSTDLQKWYFEASATEGRYYIKNKSTGKYVADAKGSTTVIVDKTKEEAQTYKLQDMGNGLWAIVGSSQNLHNGAGNYSYNVLGWGDNNAAASQWYITAVELDDAAEDLYDLKALIDKTEALIDEVGYATQVQLQATDSLAPFHLYCNALFKALNNDDTSPNTAKLLDGDPATHIHTDYRTNEGDYKADDDLDHYLRVDLGSGNAVSEFKFTYTTRNAGGTQSHPKTIKIEGSNNLMTFEEITTLPRTGEDALPGANTNNDGRGVYTSPEITSSEPYRYLRFMVTETQGNNVKSYGDHPYFYMAEFDLELDNIVRVDDKYSSEITVDELTDVFNSLLSAKEIVENTNSEQYAAACSALEGYYNTLLADKNRVETSNLTALKDELSTLISQTTSLIASCGSVVPVDEVEDEVTMYVTAGNYPYLTCSNLYQRTQDSDYDTDCSDLLDNVNTTYIHTDHGAETGTYPHYLQVAFGTSEVPAMFKFAYRTRSQGANQVPKHIIVKGSHNGTTFTDVLGEFTSSDAANPLPTTADTEWEVNKVLTGGYEYLRFYVTKSPASVAGANNTTTPFFAMSEFDLKKVIPAYYDVTLSGDAGGATEELLIKTYTKNAEAEAAFTYATTEIQVEAAIAKLTAAKEALEKAKGTAQEYTVVVVGGNSQGGVVYGGDKYTNTTIFTAPLSLEVGDLTAITLDGYVVNGVALNGTTITVTYNKIYTVQVTGGGGNGGVTYNEQNYADGATFDAQQSSFTKENLTAIVPEGYTLKEVTVNHETGVISVSYAAIPLVDTAKYYTLACKATDHSTFIRDNGSVFNGRSAEGSLFQFEAADEDNGYYIKSYVSEKYLNCTANDNEENDAVVESEEKSTVWKMAEPTHTDGVVTLTAGHDKYLNNNGNAPTYLLARYHDGGPASNNACSLWTLTEGTPIDKSALNTLIGETNTLIESCYTDEEFDYAGSLNVTEELMTATREAVTVAQEKYDSKATTEGEYEAALNALQTAKDNLQTAINYANLPVQLTFDANNPVTYKIAIDRTSTTVLAYDATSEMVAVTDFELGNKSHGWYFMATTDGKVRIMPYHEFNTTLALSTNSFEQGNSKVEGKSIGTDGYTQEWTISNTNMDEANRIAGWYNITTINPSKDETTWYFSNHGGVSNKMGFYNDANDDGSRFQFEKISFDKSEAYYTLYNYYHNEAKVSGTVTGGTVVGCYPEAAADAYNTAYSNAANVLEDATAKDEEYTNAYNALKAANEALELIMPKVGTYYTIVSACDDNNRNGQLMYATGENGMKFANDKAGTGTDGPWIRPEALWTFTEDGYMMNLQTGCHVGTSTWGGALTLVEDDAKVVSIEPLATLNGQVLLKPGGGYPLHAQASGSKIVGYSNEDNASAWYIEEVKDMDQVKHLVSITQYEHAGLYLNYPVTIPDEVKVYYLDRSKISIDDEGVGTLNLTEIEDEVIPARTAVILYAPHGNQTVGYDFVYAAAPNDEYDNLFTGSTYQTYREAEENHYYYVFGQNKGEIGLYKNGVKYKYNDGGAIEEVSEGATHYKMSANKILFDWSNNTTATMVKSFRFRLGTGGQTTSLEDALMMDNAIIYDLYGRRIPDVKVSGLYIVDGVKRYIEVK